MRTLVALLVALAVQLATGSAALAHPELDRALKLSAELDFDKALRAFDKALGSGTLTRSELVTLLSERALLLHALRRKDDVVRDFEWLAALEPRYQLDERAPPDLTAVWENIRKQSTRVELTMLAGGGQRFIKPDVKGARPPGMEVRTYYRSPPGSGAYLSQSGTEPIELKLWGTEQVEAYAEVVGPGRVVVDSAGSAQAPLLLALSLNDESPAVAAGPTPSAEEREKRRKKIIWISSAAAVVVAAVVIGAAVAASGDDGDTTRLMPVATF